MKTLPFRYIGILLLSILGGALGKGSSSKGGNKGGANSGFFGGPAAKHCKQNAKDCQFLAFLIIVIVPFMTCLYFMIFGRRLPKFQQHIRQAREIVEEAGIAADEGGAIDPPASAKFLAGHMVEDKEKWRELTLSFHMDGDHFWNIQGRSTSEEGNFVVVEGRMHSSGSAYWVEKHETSKLLVLSSGIFDHVFCDGETCLTEGSWRTNRGRLGSYEHFSKA